MASRNAAERGFGFIWSQERGFNTFEATGGANRVLRSTRWRVGDRMLRSIRWREVLRVLRSTKWSGYHATARSVLAVTVFGVRECS